MNRPQSFLNLLITITLLASLGGCTLLPKKTSEQTADGQNNANPAQADGGAGAPTAVVPLSGTWEIAFQLGDKTYKSSMDLKQDGAGFQGQGADEDSGRQFNILDGEINGTQVFFKKAYPDANPNVPPVEYAGQATMVNDKDYQGPYMNGEFTALVNGQTVSGPWEGQLSSPTQASAPSTNSASSSPASAPSNASAASTSTSAPGNASTAGNPASAAKSPVNASTPGNQPASPAPSAAQSPQNAPDLSGKWSVSYEYNFKPIKSIMFLEQENDKITGHGLDNNTKERFTIDKGWYRYPQVTLVRKYSRGAGAASNRTMAFKARVQVITTGDYRGPYMKGETQGGGNWEARMVSWH